MHLEYVCMYMCLACHLCSCRSVQDTWCQPSACQSTKFQLNFRPSIVYLNSIENKLRNNNKHSNHSRGQESESSKKNKLTNITNVVFMCKKMNFFLHTHILRTFVLDSRQAWFWRRTFADHVKGSILIPQLERFIAILTLSLFTKNLIYKNFCQKLLMPAVLLQTPGPITSGWPHDTRAVWNCVVGGAAENRVPQPTRLSRAGGAQPLWHPPSMK